MRQIILITGGIIAALSLIVGVSTFNQATNEQDALTSRLQSRAQAIAEGVADSIGPSYLNHATSSIQRTVNKFASSQKLDGIVIFDLFGTTIVSSGSSTAAIDPVFLRGVLDTGEGQGVFARYGGRAFYVFALPLTNDAGTREGAIATLQNADYIDASIITIWRDNLVRLLIQIVLISGAIFLLVRLVLFKPLARLTESMQAARRGTPAPHTGSVGFFEPLAGEISKMTSSLRQARRVASEEARLRLEKLDSPWTAERLKEFIKAYLRDRPIFVVSNREPYVHSKTKNGVEWSVPAGGVVTAIEPVMEACGGVWIAHGSGNADKETADADGKIAVPPEEPKYTLKRVWLSKKEVQGHYNGFSSEALWPLCHMAHVRPVFRAGDWTEYRAVNGHFTKTVLEEIRHVERPLILVQDYHLALAPALIKKSRPDAQVALFWHIPWPSAAQFSICPWRKEILEGMLGADLIGFHTQQHCNDFLDTVAAELEARIDFDHFAIERKEHRTSVKPFPISIAFPGPAEPAGPADRSALAALGITTEFLALGVDRLDYTKGILERLRGVEFFLRAHPEFKERFTFLQIASPTRESVEKYREYAAEVHAEADRINELMGTRAWRPIVLQHRHYSHEELRPLYQLANVCMVTSLHDGMNLVSKEYVAARTDESGALVISQFAGAARDLRGAIVVNPYSAEETAEGLYRGLSMSATEQHRRMKTMRGSVRDYNVYRWSAELIKALASL